VTKKDTKKNAGAVQSRSTQSAPKRAVKKADKTVQKGVTKAASATGVSKKSGRTAAKTPKKTLSRKTTLSPKKAKQSAINPTDLKSILTKAELEHFRTLLIAKLKEITGDVDHIEKESLRMSRQDATGDLSSMPIHMADIGSDNYEQEFTLGLMNTERKIVQEILMALRRIDEGTFGMCEGTGEPIPMARLEAYPWARYCVRYAEMIEKGQVVEVRNNSYSSGNYASVIGVADSDDEDEDDEEEDIEHEDDEASEDDDEIIDFVDDDDDEAEEDDPYYN
jgi:RNA polymerase-binding protein DksA